MTSLPSNCLGIHVRRHRSALLPPVTRFERRHVTAGASSRAELGRLVQRRLKTNNTVLTERYLALRLPDKDELGAGVGTVDSHRGRGWKGSSAVKDTRCNQFRYTDMVDFRPASSNTGNTTASHDGAAYVHAAVRNLHDVQPLCSKFCANL